MVALIKIVVPLITDVARFVVLQFRTTRSVQAENLFLRRQLGLFKERGIKPRRGGCRYANQLGGLGQALRLAGYIDSSTTENHHPMAACGLAPVLALEMSTGLTADSRRVTRTDPPDGA